MLHEIHFNYNAHIFVQNFLRFVTLCLILYFQVHIKQQDATGELSEDVKAALLQYNSIVSLSSSVRCMVQFAVCSLSVSLPLRALQ